MAASAQEIAPLRVVVLNTLNLLVNSFASPFEIVKPPGVEVAHLLNPIGCALGKFRTVLRLPCSSDLP